MSMIYHQIFLQARLADAKFTITSDVSADKRIAKTICLNYIMTV